MTKWVIFLMVSNVLCDCVAGTDIGAFTVKQPNRSTVAVVGSPYKIEWEYTPLVKILPSAIDISLENVLVEGPRKFAIVVARNFSVSGTNMIWDVDQLNDGQYQMRIGIAGRDPLLNKDACLTNGEAYGGSSSIFKITSQKQAPPIVRSKFGPELSPGLGIVVSRFIMLISNMVVHL